MTFPLIHSLSVSRSPRTPTTSTASSPKVQQVHTRLIAIIRRLVEIYSTWQLGHEKGIRFCSQLENIKLKLLDKANSSVYSEDLTSHHQRLQVVLEVFVDIVKNASETVTQLRALEQLQEDKDTVIGRTWSIRRFVAVAETLLGQYQKEYAVKEMVFQEICHRTSPVAVSMATVSWEYPKHVAKETRFLIKCLTMECGLPDLESSK